MRIAFTLYKYIPHGGMQRDFMRIARACIDRGHAVKVYVIDWQGTEPMDMNICKVPAPGWLRKHVYRNYAAWVRQNLERDRIDRLVGFNYLPRPDVYYAADGCYRYRLFRYRRRWYKHTPRARRFLEHEREICAHSMRLLCLAPRCSDAFMAYYRLPTGRVTLLPPALRYRPLKTGAGYDSRRALARQKITSELPTGSPAIRPDTTVLVTVGSHPHTKGLDRTIRAFRSLARYCHRKKMVPPQLLIVGQVASALYAARISCLGIKRQVHFIAQRDDISEVLLAADIMVHPARWEASGMVLLEAVAHGLPVLASEVCGYARHVEEARAGVVLDFPFSQHQLDRELIALCADRERLRRCRQRALEYAQCHADDWSETVATRLAVKTIEQAV